MKFYLLDEDLRNIDLASKAQELRAQGGHSEWSDESETGLHMTFGDLDGKLLSFPVGTTMQPSKRLLGIHAVVSQWATQKRTPGRRIRKVRYNTSDDQTTRRTITNFDIIQWQNSLILVSEFLQSFEYTILTCWHS
jgi:hypothetical protein